MLNKIVAIAVCFSVFFFGKEVNAQSFLNGSFETNSCPAGVDQINLTNASYNAFVSNSFSFGTYSGIGDMDVLTLATYGLAQQGLWYVAFTGGGTDQISLTLNAPLVMGNTYTIRFYDRAYSSFAAQPFEIGLSTVNNAYGTFMASTGVVPTAGVWNLRTITFVAPNNGQYITVRTAGALGNWSQVDNFSFVSALPIDLINFSSQCINNSVKLNWSTASEKNNAVFIVERSENGIDFTEIGQVKGSNNSNQKADYSFIDNRPLKGVSYYRLQQIDYDKNTSFSQIIVTETCESKLYFEYEIYPNPTTDYLNITVSAFTPNDKLTIISSVGKVVYETSIQNTNNKINLAELDAGIYLLQISNHDKTVSKKFTKN